MIPPSSRRRRGQGTDLIGSVDAPVFTLIPHAISIIASASALSLVEGNFAQISVALSRVGGYPLPVTVTLTGLPSGVTADPVVFSGSDSIKTFNLESELGSQIGTFAIVMNATGSEVSAATDTFDLTTSEAPVEGGGGEEPPPSSEGLINFSDSAVELFLGPQADAEVDDVDVTARWYSNFQSVTRNLPTYGTMARAAEYPVSTEELPHGAAQAGTLTLTNGSAIVTITGATFGAIGTFPSSIIYVDVPAVSDTIAPNVGGVAFGEAHKQYGLISSIDSGSQLTLNSPWSGPSVSGATWRKQSATLGASGYDYWNAQYHYYDFTFVAYQCAYRNANTADGVQMLTDAHRVARIWWNSAHTQMSRRYGFTAGEDGRLGSRNAALGGLVAWALHNCPDASGTAQPSVTTQVWAYVMHAAGAYYNQWLEGRIALEGSQPYLVGDVRDGGYAIHWCTLVACFHPDSGVRATYIAKAVEGASYYCRHQEATGEWIYRNGAWINYTTGDETFAAQPFINALWMEFLAFLHRAITSDLSPDPTWATTYATEATTFLAALKLGVEGWMRSYAGAPHFDGYSATYDGTTAEVRANTYSVGGDDLGWGLGDPQPSVPGYEGTRRWNDPANNVEFNAPSLSFAGAVSAQRFLNADFPGVPYYCAYHSTGSERETFLDYGDEVMDSNFAYLAGDGYRSQWATAGKHKDHNQHMRFGPRGVAYRRLCGRL